MQISQLTGYLPSVKRTLVMNPNKLLLIETLIEVIDSGSFSAAADKLGVSQSTVSRRIANLEDNLGGEPLFKRSSRWIEPTPKTTYYVENVRALLRQFDELESHAKEQEQEIKGDLIISMPPSLGRAKLLSVLVDQFGKHPGIQCQFDLSERYIDFSQSNVDIAVRIQPSKQTGISQTVLANTKLVLCASPSYLTDYGTPRTVKELANHEMIGLTSMVEHRKVRSGESTISDLYAVKPKVVLNDVSGCHQLIQDGAGIGLIPDFLTTDSIQAGELVELLTTIKRPSYKTYALYPWGLKDTKKIQLALAALKSAFQ